MPIEVTITPDGLPGYSPEAQVQLRRAVIGYAEDLIQEANRIEADRNRLGGEPEVTGGIVEDARVTLERGLGANSARARSVWLRVAASVLPLVVGMLFDFESMKDYWYTVLFLVIFAATLIVVTFSVMKE